MSGPILRAFTEELPLKVVAFLLAVTLFVVVRSDKDAATGATVTVSDVTRNASPVPAAASVTRIYLSVDGVLDGTDVPLAERAVPALGPQQEHGAATAVTFPGTAVGRFHLIALANATGAVAEVETANNTAVSLPIKQVVLFSSGVGHFTRAGSVDGEARVDLTFPEADVNDLLKSMVLQDLSGKGHVSAVSYDSREPIARTLASFAVNLNNNPTYAQILQQIRGERVEVVLQSTAANQPANLTGCIGEPPEAMYVEVHLSTRLPDGSTVLPPAFSQAVTGDDIVTKFRSNLEYAGVSATRTEQLLDAVHTVDSCPDSAAFADLLSGR